MTEQTTNKKPLNDRVRRGMEAVRKLIADRKKAITKHAANGDLPKAQAAHAEKEAAERKLARWIDEYDVTGTFGTGRASDSRPSHLWNHGAWEGEKCTTEIRRMPLKDLTAIIREDIKVARKIGQKTRPKAGDVAVKDPIGDAPKGIKFRTRMRHGTGIEVVIDCIPREWGFQRAIDDRGYELDIPTPALRELIGALEEIHGAYNYDNSDAMTDYYDRNYWGAVEVQAEGEKYSRLYWSRESAYYRYSKPNGGPVD
jgi:hypothetical protein